MTILGTTYNQDYVVTSRSPGEKNTEVQVITGLSKSFVRDYIRRTWAEDVEILSIRKLHAIHHAEDMP